jgi:putative DNA primase/helicase
MARLEAELPAILLWSIAGWARLRRRGFFVQPESGEVLLRELDELSSPVSTFLEDCTEESPNGQVLATELYAAWKAWCAEAGREHAGTVASLGRWLRAALPNLETVQHRVDGKRVRSFRGLRLTSNVTNGAF